MVTIGGCASMFMCQRQYSQYSKYRSSGTGGVTSDRRHSPVTICGYTKVNGGRGSCSSTATSTTTNTNEDLESSSAGTTTECSSSLSGCLGNVIGSARGGSAKCSEKKPGFIGGVSFSANNTPCHSETRSNGGFRRRQRRRRRPVYFGGNGVTVVAGTISASIASASPDCRADSSANAEATRRRRPVQPWHIQQQATARVSEVRYQMSNLSTTYGNGAQHPVTMVDSSWWPVSQPVSVCIDMYKGFKAWCGLLIVLLNVLAGWELEWMGEKLR